MTNHEKAIRIAQDVANHVAAAYDATSLPIERASAFDGARIAVEAMAAHLQVGERLTGTVQAALHAYNTAINSIGKTKAA